MVILILKHILNSFSETRLIHLNDSCLRNSKISVQELIRLSNTEAAAHRNPTGPVYRFIKFWKLPRKPTITIPFSGKVLPDFLGRSSCPDVFCKKGLFITFV